MVDLVWYQKYIKDKKAAPVRISLPFQNIETVNESVQERQKSLELFASGQKVDWRNRLIWGDKKYILPSLLSEYAGRINLIYIDPPFNTAADFSFKATIPDNPDTKIDETTNFVKLPSIIEQKAYRDTWGVTKEEKAQNVQPLDKYLKWFYETIIILRDLLTDDGSIYIHLDWHAGHYCKTILDEVFGYDNFRNEIVWHYRTGNLSTKQFQRKHDVILFYSKSDKMKFNPLEFKEYYTDIYGSNFKPSFEGRKQGKDKKGIFRMSMVDDVWDLSAVFTLSPEHLPYNTQKPEVLLERIIQASSDENDIVLDCFCGSGTTPAVAEKLNRRWIACDLGRFAIHTTRKRLLSIDNIKPFLVQNLGKYERQQWMEFEFTDLKNKRALQEKTYRNFILDLYHADYLNGYVWLHGKKSDALIHVGSVDTPISSGDVKSIIQEFWKIVGKKEKNISNKLDIVGWEFSFEINEVAKQYALKNNVDIKFKKIPREILDSRAVEQGEIQFFELASLDVDVKKKNKSIILSLNNFIIPTDDIPEEVRKSITHWQQLVDYWAVDWDFKDDTFHNQWQSYRTKKNKKIDLEIKHEYSESNNYIIQVKVVDILGNDTTKNIEIKI